MALPRLGNTRHDAALARAIQQEEDAELARELSHGGQRAAPPAPRGQARQGVNCPRGCGLKRFTATSAQRIVCDVCSSRIAPGRPALSCLRCDFDVCEACFEDPPMRQPARRGPMGFGVPLNMEDILLNERDPITDRPAPPWGRAVMRPW